MPRILLQQGTNLVNKFALLLHKCRFAQDSRDKPENDGSWRCWLSICCSLFNHPSPADKSATSPARGEVLNNIILKGLDVVRQYAVLFERRVQSSTRVRKTQVVTRQTNPIGRSMTEMLGVLAIIAVLSVGGIAGYSKAMEKFKLNKVIEEYTYFITGLLEHLSDYEKLNPSSSQLFLTEFVLTANLTPTTWSNSGIILIDSQNHWVWPFVRSGHLVFEIGIIDQQSGIILPDKTNLEYCRALYRNVMKPLHSSLYYVSFYRHNVATDYTYYGDNYCRKEDKCLREITLDKIDEICKSCTDKSPWCHIVMTF